MTNICYLSLGTNLGDKEGNILEAYRRIEESVGRIIRRSSFYHSEPWGFKSDNDFVNTAICCETAMTPQQLLMATQKIEKDMGRTMKSTDGQYHDRIIDIDILLYNDISVNEPGLTIPHPLMQERDFVMNPLKEIQL
ncbi:MAG: 2-amino-4-hydroxy-6-hydroxymethyldihydropteridine diphosphokinase [Prevotella sp.]|nr:2-amino-4-hydroxy-6-hydroxymethyldihydropteridine diphosphokinase [Candidatus Prevotella equi]